MGPPIPRRSFDCGPLRGIVQDSISKSSSNHEKHGTSDQRDKIPSKTSPKIRMAGGPMGFDISPGTGNTRKDIKSTKQAGRCYKRENLYCERYSMHPGTSKLDCTMRSNSTAYSIYNKANPKDVQIPNIRLNMLDSKKPQNAPMRLDLRGTFPSSPRLPSSGYYCTNGRIIKRLGIPNKPTKILRKIRLHNELLHKRPRIDDSMVCPSNGVKEKCCDPSPMRQYNFNTSTKKGGSLNFQLATLAELIWRRAALLNWTLQVAHIGGAFNVLADQLSRNEALSTEWSLSHRDFHHILKLNPRVQVDLFATSLNNKLKTFVSPCPDQLATAVDALTIDWERWEHLYLYPPSPLISRVLGKINRTSFKSAVLVTPETPTRPWYMALSLQQIPSTLMEVQLQQVVVDRVITQQQTTKLRAWQLSGRHINQDFRHAMQH